MAPQASLVSVDSISCCYTLAINYQSETDGIIDGLETNLISNGAIFSAVQYDLTSGWQYEQLQARRRLRWTHEQGNLPEGSVSLFTFCIDGWDEPEPAQLALRWRRGNVPVAFDTLTLSCQGCLRPQWQEVICEADSSRTYRFQFTNTTGFTVHSVRIGEENGQDLIAEEELLFDPPLAPNALSDTLSVRIQPAADTLQSLCFLLTPSRLDSSGLRLDCCTAEHCIDLPECDRCCTDYADFTDDVALGYVYQIECFYEATITFNMQARALGLGACDLVSWSLDDLTMGDDIAGTTTGNNAINFFDRRSSEYALCMEVVRRNEDGTPCFGPDSTLVYCDTFFIDCPCIQETAIDLNFDCAIDLSPVCGCDSMTYLNDCAATNWAGVLAFQTGECPYLMPPLDTITLQATPDTSGQVLLDWATTGSTIYRYFLIQRCLAGGQWETIGQTEASTFSFTDPDSGGGLIKYRVIGVTFPGKYVLSNEEEVMVVGTSEVVSEYNPQLWPNPVQTFFYVQTLAPLRISVWDASGRLQTQLPQSKPFITIDAADWPPGLYWVQISHSDGQTSLRPLLKL